jgi:triosephosphate isomerase
VAIFPPFPYLAQAAALLADRKVAWGGQSLSEHADGAYTGEVSGAMLCDLGCHHVLVGHSERRSLFGETDDMVARKVQAALTAGLSPVLCFGETLAERESGTTLEVVRRQLRVVLEPMTDWPASLLLAYEPVWAIGTGRTASPAQAQEVHAEVRRFVVETFGSVAAGVRILYGGSVKPGNARELFEQPDIDGGLIGGASLKAEEFLAICRAAV